eukprot:364661-Chlamydomonas_euryale.AAC.6
MLLWPGRGRERAESRQEWRCCCGQGAAESRQQWRCCCGQGAAEGQNPGRRGGVGVVESHPGRGKLSAVSSQGGKGIQAGCDCDQGMAVRPRRPHSNVGPGHKTQGKAA